MTAWMSRFAILTSLSISAAVMAPFATAQNTDVPAAEQQTEADGNNGPTGQPGETDNERNQRFAEYMSGVKFIGRFTVLDAQGQSGRMPEEEYTIRKCEKLPQGDLFRFTARIRYGDTDTEVPMDLPVKWAGRTPVITLEQLWIPGLGTFSSRVVIHDDRYAGTWDHGEKGGHLFGRIERLEESAEKETDR